MNKRILNKIIRNETGNGLVLSLMVLLVLSVLGATLGVVTVGSYRLADNTQESNSAYYIAEAGANMAYEEISNIVHQGYKQSSSLSSETFYQNINPKINSLDKVYAASFEEQAGRSPSATITIDGPMDEGEERQYTIVSIGEVDGNTRLVEKPFVINWIEKDTGEGGRLPEIPEKSSVLVKDRFNFLGATINGYVYVDSTEPNSVHLTNSGQHGPDRLITSQPEPLSEGNEIYLGTGENKVEYLVDGNELQRNGLVITGSIDSMNAKMAGTHGVTIILTSNSEHSNPKIYETTITFRGVDDNETDDK